MLIAGITCLGTPNTSFTTGELRAKHCAPNPSFTNQSGHMSQTNPIASHRIPSHPTFIHPFSHFITHANAFIPFFHSYNTSTERNS